MHRSPTLSRSSVEALYETAAQRVHRKVCIVLPTKARGYQITLCPGFWRMTTSGPRAGRYERVLHARLARQTTAIAGNADIIRRTVEQFGREGDFPWELYLDDIALRTRAELTGGSEYRGQDGIREAMRSYHEAWAEIRPSITDITEVREDVLVAALHFELRAHSGIEIELDEHWAYWFRDGKLARIEQHGTREEALSSCAGERS